jgi:hypothetical protein
MNIKLETSEIYNTGGGCMVYFVDAETDGNIVQFGINEECIVGYTKRFQDDEGDWTGDEGQFTTESWKEVVDKFGTQVAADLFIGFHKHWKWTDCLEDSEAVGGIVQLINFTTAACKLSDNWSEILNCGYPFDDNFEQIMLDIFNWQQTVLTRNNK